MAFHLYILPIETITGPYGNPSRVPKYIHELGLTSVVAVKDYGWQPVCVCVADLTDGQDATITANADVFKIPDNMDQTVTVAPLSNALELVQIPANWVTGAQTYRQVMRSVLNIFNFIGKYGYIANDFTPLINGTTVTLSSQFRTLTAKQQADLITTANFFNLDTSSLSGNNTLRAMIKNLADQLNVQSFVLGGITV